MDGLEKLPPEFPVTIRGEDFLKLGAAITQAGAALERMKELWAGIDSMKAENAPYGYIEPLQKEAYEKFLEAAEHWPLAVEMIEAMGEDLADHLEANPPGEPVS